jgi:hypothetical protein
LRAIVSRARQITLTTVVIVALSLFRSGISFCEAASAHLSLIAQDIDSPGKITLVIDHVEKLAGMKVTVTYDDKQLKFRKAEKAKSLASFMHVVNDKNPGSVIIVLASASGVSGTNLPLLHLEFTPINSATNNNTKQTVSVSQIQLMNENLQEITGDHPTYTF